MFDTRRSIRKYKKQSIDRNALEQILKALLSAPTARNLRKGEFIVVEDKLMLDELSKTRPGSAFLEHAACAIVILGNSAESELWIEDSSIAAYTIQLAAHNIGLGTCWAQIRGKEYKENRMATDYLKEKLQFPDHLEVECVVGIGYPDEEKPAHVIKEEDWKRIHYEKF